MFAQDAILLRPPSPDVAATWQGEFRTGTAGGTWLVVLLLCLGQVLLWTLAFGLTYQAPEPDSAEQLVWSFSMQNGYWKHPPLPTWLMRGLVTVFGASVALPFAAAQLSIVVALALTWRLGCELMTPRRSLIAMVLTSLVTYHNIGGDSFNHSTVLLPFQAATFLLFFKATRSGKWRYWALAGIFAGLSMLVKYVALVPLASLLVYFAVDRQLHQRREFIGATIAMMAFAAVLTPHFLWLTATDFMPLWYARSVAHPLPDIQATTWSLFDFGVTQAERLLPLFAALWLVLSRRAAGVSPPLRVASLSQRNALFLWTIGFAPLALTLAIGLFTQTELQGRWGTNLFMMSGWLALAASDRADTPKMLNRALFLTFGIQLLLCLGMTLSKTVVADQLRVRTRANFPAAALAREAQAAWSANMQVPMRVVIADTWLGGSLIAAHGEPLAVLIDGQPEKSPWIAADTVRHCGALVLVDRSIDTAASEEQRPALTAYMALASVSGTWTLPWNGTRRSTDETPRGSVQWGIIRPESGEDCSLPAALP